MIKGTHTLIVLCALLSSVLVSCGQLSGKMEKIEISVEEETELSTESDMISGIEQKAPETEADMSVERTLSEEELQFFTDYLSQNDNYGFLLSEYDSPSEIDLTEVFYNGAGIQMEFMTEQEKQAYMKAVGQDEIYTDMVNLSSEQIDKFLIEKIGISNKDMETPLPWIYVPEYDSYYFEAGDTNRVFFICLDGSVVNEQYYTLHVQKENVYAAYQEEISELVLEKSGDRYQFISNKVISDKVHETGSDADMSIENR